MSEEAEVPDPEQGVPIEVRLTPEFFRDAAKRGVAPDVLFRRLADLFAVMGREGAELFEDWEQWPQAKRIQWCMDGARERAWLEFPYLDQEE